MIISSDPHTMIDLRNKNYGLFHHSDIQPDGKTHPYHFLSQYLGFLGYFYATRALKLIRFRGRPNVKFFVGLVIKAMLMCHIPMELVECLLYCGF